MLLQDLLRRLIFGALTAKWLHRVSAGSNSCSPEGFRGGMPLESAVCFVMARSTEPRAAGAGPEMVSSVQHHNYGRVPIW